MGFFDYVLGFGRVVTSTLAGAQKAMLVNVSGVGEGDDEKDEGATQEPLYGQLGVVARPRAPDGDGAAEVVAARTADGLQPIAHRDLRLNARVTPKLGEVDLVQYGGGFLSLADNADAAGTTAVLYAPALTGDGAVDKAHVMALDSSAGNLSVTIAHADGMALTMAAGGKNSAMLKNKAGDAYVEVNDDGLTLNGGKLFYNGGQIVLNVPYAYAGPVPTKAHAIVVDPTTGNESVAIVHGDGMAITLSGGKAVIKNAAGDAYVELNSTGIILNGNVKINGAVMMGNPASAEPVMLATALLAWIGQVNAALTAISLAAGSTTNPAITAPAAVPLAATLTSAK